MCFKRSLFCFCLFFSFGNVAALYTNKYDIIVVCIVKPFHHFTVIIRLSNPTFKNFYPRAPGANCTASANCCWRHLPLDPAERQQHQWGRPNHRQGGGIPHRVWHHVRPAARRQDHAQDRPPGSRHRVRDQCSADQTSGGRHRSPRTTTEGQDQMCWWGQKYIFFRSTLWWFYGVT